MTTATPAREAEATSQGDARDRFARAIAQQAIRRTAADPFFVGHALAVCEDRFGVNEELLARYLRCTSGALGELALSHLPDPEEAGYAAALGRVAEHTGVDALQLAALIELSEPLPRREPALSAALDAYAASALG